MAIISIVILLMAATYLRGGISSVVYLLFGITFLIYVSAGLLSALGG